MKHLGKIDTVSFGMGGYQGMMIGIHFSFIFEECCVVGDSKCAWSLEIECDSGCKWTEQDRSNSYDEIMRYTSKLLTDAKVKKVTDLKGKPVELEFDGNGGLGSGLKSWRILTEVL